MCVLNLGGCGRLCHAKLECGHACIRLCHPDDPEHKKTNCKKMIEKTCVRGHKTSIMCHKTLRCTHNYKAVRNCLNIQ